MTQVAFMPFFIILDSLRHVFKGFGIDIAPFNIIDIHNYTGYF